MTPDHGPEHESRPGAGLVSSSPPCHGRSRSALLAGGSSRRHGGQENSTSHLGPAERDSQSGAVIADRSTRSRSTTREESDSPWVRSSNSPAWDRSPARVAGDSDSRTKYPLPERCDHHSLWCKSSPARRRTAKARGDHRGSGSDPRKPPAASSPRPSASSRGPSSRGSARRYPARNSRDMHSRAAHSSLTRVPRMGTWTRSPAIEMPADAVARVKDTQNSRTKRQDRPR